MADWKFKAIYRLPEKGFSITQCTPTFGDAFSPPIPTDRLCTLNWVNKGQVHLYSAAMNFIATHGRASQMRVDDPGHLGMGKAVLIAATDDIEYYCLTPTMGYMDGTVMELLPEQEINLSGLIGKRLFISDGSLVFPGSYPKHQILFFENSDAQVLRAGPEGAVLVLFWPAAVS